MKLSIIISTFNEENNSFFINTLAQVKELTQVEIIVVDKNSTDKTKQICLAHGVKYINTDLNSRAQRLNLGASKAKGDLLLFHHPRSIVDIFGLKYLLTINNTQQLWGGFTHRFDNRNIILNFTSWYSNNVRGKIREILYLDHCIFVSSNLFHKVKFSNVDIFEDTIFSIDLSKYSKPNILKFSSTTSSIRFLRNGIIRQSILNQVMKVAFSIGIDHKTMNRIYEYGLNLNSKY